MKNLFFALILLAVASCGKKNEESKSDVAVVPQENVQVQASDQDCFDLKMDTWFVAFNKYQGEGDDMKSADKKALQDAEEEFLKCQGTAGLSSEDKK